MFTPGTGSAVTANHLFYNLQPNDDNRGGGVFFRVFRPDDTSSYTFVTGQSSTYYDSGLTGSKLIAVHKGAEKITGVRIAMQSNTASLSASIYGVI